MNQPAYRVKVDINNANWVSRMMAKACSKEQGITRAMRRVFDWICWGNVLRFVVKLAPYKIVHPEDSLSHEYTGHQYLNYRASARNIPYSVDEVDDDSAFPLINNYQFQLRMISWAEQVLTDWRREATAQRRLDRPITEFDRDLSGQLSLNYRAGSDDEGTIFYVPEFKLAVPQDWEQSWTVKNKQRVAEMVDWLAHQIENMFDGFPYVFDDQRNVAAQRKLAELAEEDEPDPVQGSHLDIEAAVEAW